MSRGAWPAAPLFRTHTFTCVQSISHTHGSTHLKTKHNNIHTPITGGIEFHLVTSRQYRIQPETEAWIAKHYPGVFTALHFGNHYALTAGMLDWTVLEQERGVCHRGLVCVWEGV